VQTRILEAFGPLAALHANCYEAMADKSSLDPKEVLEGISNAISLLGNANAQACRERRRVILRRLSPELVSYGSKTPLTLDGDLFGSALWKTLKESMEFGRDLRGLVRKSRECMYIL
jgi:hypothetical protein